MKKLKIIKNQDGQVMLEFTMSILLLLVMYLGLITLGLFLIDNSAVPKVARDGARQAALTGSESAGYAAAQASAWAWGLDPNRLTISVKQSSGDKEKAVKCETNYRSDPFARTFPTLFGGKPMTEINLKGESTFKWWDEVK